MKDLIEKLEALKGPGRECDAGIAIAIGFEPAGLFPHTIKGAMRHYAGDMDGFVEDMNNSHSALSAIPRFTSSIDAALTLIPEGRKPEIVMPYDEIRYPESFAYSVSLHSRDGSYTSKENGEHESMAIAICIAALRARQSLLSGER